MIPSGATNKPIYFWRPIVSLLALLWFTTPCNIGYGADIAILKSADLPYYEQAVVGFRAGLPATTTIREYNLHGQLEQGLDIARSLRASPPDMVLAVGLKAAMAAKLQIFDQPVVFCMVLNPEAHGLPASNMTGVAVRTPADIQLSTLRSVMPGRTRIGVLYDEDQSGGFVHEALHAAKHQGLDLVAVAVHKQEEIPLTLRGLLAKIDVLWLIQDQLVVSESAIPFFIESTLSAKIPLFTFSSTLVQQGAVSALVVDPWTVGQQAARIALSQLKQHGALNGQMDPPDHPQLALNLNSAEYLGLTLNPELIRLAGQIFSGSGAVARRVVPSDLIP